MVRRSDVGCRFWVTSATPPPAAGRHVARSPKTAQALRSGRRGPWSTAFAFGRRAAASLRAHREGDGLERRRSCAIGLRD